MGTIGDYSWDDFRELKSDTIKLVNSTENAVANWPLLL